MCSDVGTEHDAGVRGRILWRGAFAVGWSQGTVRDRVTDDIEGRKDLGMMVSAWVLWDDLSECAGGGCGGDRR